MADSDTALNAASKAPLPPQAKAATKLLKEASNFWSIAQEFLFGSYQMRISNFGAISMLVVAGILDLLSAVPVIEVITDITAICIFVPWFLIDGYDWTKNILRKFTVNIAAPIIELIPALSALPAILFAVGYNAFQMRFEDWTKYREKKEENEKKQKEEEQKKRAQQTQNVGIQANQTGGEGGGVQSSSGSQAYNSATQKRDYKVPRASPTYRIQEMLPSNVGAFESFSLSKQQAESPKVEAASSATSSATLNTDVPDSNLIRTNRFDSKNPLEQGRNDGNKGKLAA